MEQGLLPSAAAMLAFGLILLYGGLTLFITIALRKEKQKAGRGE